jgi:hypothetical protein
MQDKKSTTEKNAPTSLAISMAMRIRRYNAERHWTPPLGDYLSRIVPADAMVIDFGVKN